MKLQVKENVRNLALHLNPNVSQIFEIAAKSLSYLSTNFVLLFLQRQRYLMLPLFCGDCHCFVEYAIVLWSYKSSKNDLKY